MSRFFMVLFALAAIGPLGASVLARDPVVAARDVPASHVRALRGEDEARIWRAVGRLDTGVSFCTATLIAPDLALTAAHCLFSDAGARLPDADLRFFAGLRDGQAQAIRRVAYSAVLPGYARPFGQGDIGAVAQDVALLALDPSGADDVQPITGRGRAAPGDAVTLVSYGMRREGFASIEENCRILSQQGGVQALSCHVVAGSSGAPVVALEPDGPQIVAVVSGHTDLAGQDVTVAVMIDDVLPVLVDEVAGLPPLPRRPRLSQGGSVTLRPVEAGGTGRDGIGARFVRP